MKIALLQMKYQGSHKKTIEKTVENIRQASRDKSSLVILQELHQGEYFCQSEDTKNFEYAKNFDDDVIFWSKVAKQYGVVLVTSLFEQRTAGLYHNTAVVFDKDGTMAGKYRKMHIPDDPSFHEKFYFTPGDLGFKPIKTSIGTLGILLCWDQWYPEAARIMSLNGAQILIYPTAIGWFDNDSKEEKKKQLKAWKIIQQSHAIANSIPVVCVNRVGLERHPRDLREQGIRFWGNSFVCDGWGSILAKGEKDKEEIVYAKLDLKQSKEIRDIWPFFRDRRIDAYKDILQRYCW